MSVEHRHSPLNLRNAIPFDITLNESPRMERQVITFRGVFIGVDQIGRAHV